MSVTEQVSIRDLKQMYYMFITTNEINSGRTGVNGTINSFSVKINTISLDVNKEWTAEVIHFGYKNILTPADSASGLPIVPIILTDLTKVVQVNNSNSSIIYKCNKLTQSVAPLDMVQSDVSNNFNLVLPINNNMINTINFNIVRSDNGQPFPLDPAGYVTMTILLIGQ